MRFLKFEVQPIVKTEIYRKQNMWQNDSSSWSQPTTAYSSSCLQRRPTTCTDTLPIQTHNWIYLLLSFNRMKRKTLKTTKTLQRRALLSQPWTVTACLCENEDSKSNCQNTGYPTILKIGPTVMVTFCPIGQTLFCIPWGYTSWLWLATSLHGA
jgi:hypothetical protein